MIRESTLIDREQTLNLSSSEGVSNGPLTLQTHTAIPQILVLLIAPSIRTETVKSFASIKASIEYLNQFRDPAQLIEDEQVIFLLILANLTVWKLIFSSWFKGYSSACRHQRHVSSQDRSNKYDNGGQTADNPQGRLHTPPRKVSRVYSQARVRYQSREYKHLLHVVSSNSWPDRNSHCQLKRIRHHIPYGLKFFSAAFCLLFLSCILNLAHLKSRLSLHFWLKETFE